MKAILSDIMTRELVVVEEWENLLDVARDMERHSLRYLPVVDEGRLVGLLSHRDLMRLTASYLDGSPVRAARDEAQKEGTFVFNVMTRDVTTARPETTVIEAARTLASARFGCLPVVGDDGILVGIVTENDLLRALAENLTAVADRASTSIPPPADASRTPALDDRDRDPVSR